MGIFFKDFANSFNSTNLSTIFNYAKKEALGGLMRGARQGMINALTGGSEVTSVDNYLDDYLPTDAEFISQMTDKRGYNFAGGLNNWKLTPTEVDKNLNKKLLNDPTLGPNTKQIRNQIYTESSNEIEDVISASFEEYCLSFAFPQWTYADWINERSMWQRGMTSIAGEPGWFYFKVFFDFNTQQGLFGGLLNDRDINMAVNSAGKFLRSGRKYYGFENLEQRLVALKKFASMLSYIETNAPWFFKSIKGLDKIQSPISDFSKDKFIEIGCSTESVDLRLTTLLDLYRFAAFDDILNKEIIPDNLRKFDMSIVVFNTPIKKFHTAFKSQSLGRFDYKSIFNAHKKNYANIMSYKMYTFKNCEIDLETYNTSQPSDLNNETAFQYNASIKIKYDKIFTHTSNEFIGMLFGVDGIYYNQYHNTGLNLGTNDPYLINRISGMTIQEKRYEAMRKALYNFSLDISNLSAYQELVDASELISRQVLHLPTPVGMDLAKSALLGALKARYDGVSKLGNLFGDTAPGSAYFSDKILRTKYGDDYNGPGLQLNYQPGFFSQNKTIKKVDWKGSILRTFKALNIDNLVQPKVDINTTFEEESLLSKSATVQKPYYRSPEDRVINSASSIVTYELNKHSSTVTHPHGRGPADDDKIAKKMKEKDKQNYNVTTTPYAYEEWKNGVKITDKKEFAERVASELLKTNKSTAPLGTQLPYLPDGKGVDVEKNNYNQNVTQIPHLPSEQSKEIKEDNNQNVTEKPHLPSEQSKEIKEDNNQNVTEKPHLPSERDMSVEKDNNQNIIQTPYLPSGKDMVVKKDDNNQNVTQSPYLPTNNLSIKLNNDEVQPITQTPYNPSL